MNVEDLSPEQVIRMLLLGLIILSLFVLSIASFIYWMHRIATKQKFNIANGPLATIGFIDCAQTVGLVMFLLVVGPLLAGQLFPNLKQGLATESSPETSKNGTQMGDIEESTEGGTENATEGEIETEDGQSNEVDNIDATQVIPFPGYFTSTRTIRTDREGGLGSPISDPITPAFDPLESLERVTSDAKVNKSSSAIDELLGLDKEASKEAVNHEDGASADSVSNQGAAEEKPKKEISPNTVILSGVAATMQLLAVFIMIGLIRLRTGCRFKQIGLRTDSLPRDIGVGLWVLFLVIPILMVFSGLVNYYTKTEYNHPVIDMMTQHPWAFGVVAWMAVIVAPISEEFLFRTMLIGFFESIHFGFLKSARSFFLGWMPSSGLDASPAREQLSIALRPTAPVIEPVPTEDAGRAEEYSPPWWPALLSGLLFGVAHWDYGLSWLPLVFFGIVLGRVYQLRQSLVTCITIHMAFNAINLLNLWLSIGLPRG